LGAISWFTFLLQSSEERRAGKLILALCAMVGGGGAPQMNKLWLTYAWVDNEEADVDHVIGELNRAGLDVHFDKRKIIAGQRLWSQIDRFITDPQQTDS
jgi:hypothetical protein